MKADATSMVQLMTGPRQFVIPVFQRDYSWTEAQCQQFLDDVERVATEGPDATHFTGSIVYVAGSEHSAVLPQWMVIDGQQRLTTSTILLIALRERIRSAGIEVPPQDSPDALDDQYLLNRYAPSPALRSKLALRGEDHRCLLALLGRDTPGKTASRVVENHAFFAERLEDLNPVQVLAGLRRLMVVSVSLHSGQDNPQLIFESLNSTGLSLAQADLVRNYVLMGHAEPKQTQWYERYWKPLEAAFGLHYRDSFDSFLRDFLTLELRPSKLLKLDRVYREFRHWYPPVQGDDVSVEKLEKLGRYGSYYCRFFFGEEEPGLAEAVSRLRQLVDVASPVVMVLYEAHVHCRTLDRQGLVASLELIESYVFRRSAIGAQTRSLGTVFALIASRIKLSDPLGSLKIALARQRKSAQFPDDDAFENGLVAADIYGRRNCFYLLERLTNAGREKVQTDNLTVEHVLPQNPKLSKAWQEMLGPEWKSVQERCLHKLGNLTLTAFNPEFSDRPFAEKLARTPGGYASSPVWLNESVAQETVWGEAQVTRRGAMLAKRALSVWRPLQVDSTALAEAELEEQRARSSAFKVDELPWTPSSRKLFDLLRDDLNGCGDDVAELPYQKSIVYRSPEWFVEVLPRKHKLVIRLAPDPEDLSDLCPALEASDDWSFIANSIVEGGAVYTMRSDADAEVARRLVRRAYEIVEES